MGPPQLGGLGGGSEYRVNAKSVPRNLKGGGQFPVSVSTENIGEDQKKRSSRLSSSNLPPKSSEDQNKKKRSTRSQNLRCPVSLTAHICQLIFQRGSATPAPPSPLDTPLNAVPFFDDS